MVDCLKRINIGLLLVIVPVSSAYSMRVKLRSQEKVAGISNLTRLFDNELRFVSLNGTTGEEDIYRESKDDPNKLN